MEKRKQDSTDYDIEMPENLERTKKIYYYFPVETSNDGNKNDVNNKLKRKVKDKEDFCDSPLNDHKSLEKQSKMKKIKVKADK